MSGGMEDAIEECRGVSIDHPCCGILRNWADMDKVTIDACFAWRAAGYHRIIALAHDRDGSFRHYTITAPDEKVT